MKRTFTIGILLSFCLHMATAQQRDLQFMRPYDQRGLNVFEPGKEDTIPFTDLHVRVGGNFALQFQGLEHSNAAVERYDATGNDLNQLMEIGPGFNLATANLNLDVQLADGIRMNLITYLSSRHHPEAWVKGGFLQIDKMLFLNSGLVDNIMEYVTVRVGHMEINYGDAHFRRTDNGNAFYNPFVGNYIMDAFTTEIGGEVYAQFGNFLVMAGATGGEIQGGVTNPGRRQPTFLGKVGYDGQVGEDLRLRLTASAYSTAGSVNNTLYSGDRAGSRYYMVLENFLATPAAQFTSGRFNPGFRDEVTAVVINPFVKFHGLELFGNFEQATGRAHTETGTRTWNQIGADAVYRFGRYEKFYVAGRYNTVSGTLMGGQEASIDRVQAALGWFVTPNILAKVEYVDQQHNDFPDADIRHGGRFNGFMFEGAIAF
jgi:hypothetical protein